jgi:hypothetical protein
VKSNSENWLNFVKCFFDNGGKKKQDFLLFDPPKKDVSEKVQFMREKGFLKNLFGLGKNPIFFSYWL